MRSREDIGGFENEKVDHAYATYASLYLDFADDNYNHFFIRQMDTQPLTDAQVAYGDDEGAYNAYMAAAYSIASQELNSYYNGDKEALYKDYPYLREYMDGKLEAEKQAAAPREFYETSDGWFTYYVNPVTKEKKLHLAEGDVLIDHKVDDFYRGSSDDAR